MGAIRTIFGIIFILYGISMLLNGSFIVLGMNEPITFNPEGSENTRVIVSQIIPLELFGFLTILWGLLWIWIGGKVMRGGKQQ